MQASLPAAEVYGWSLEIAVPNTWQRLTQTKNPTKQPSFTFNVNIRGHVSFPCSKGVLSCYEGPCLLYERS